jgi:hypothetical protein
MPRRPCHTAARQAEGFTAAVCRAEGGCGAADGRVPDQSQALAG